MPRQTEFERLMLPHLAAAYNLARWLMRNPTDADDMVQEAYLRALRGFDRYGGGSAAAWLLAIVRNTCLTSLKRAGTGPNVVRFEATPRPDQPDPIATLPDPAPGPAERLDSKQQDQRVRTAIASLPDGLREVLVLREIEELSYGEIAQVAGIPIGTVMSRLSRARQHMRTLLVEGDHAQHHNV